LVAKPLAGVGYGLAGKATGHDRDGLYLRPVDGRDVAEVGHVGQSVCEDLAGAGVDV
jgi:hypothetical protein